MFKSPSDFSDGELDVMARRFDLILGLDAHGTRSPGALALVRKRDASVAALCYAEAMGYQLGRFPQIELTEDAFLHSTDPASLAVVAQGGKTWLWFQQDTRAGRVLQLAGGKTGRIDRYRVEVATADGSYQLVGTVDPGAANEVGLLRFEHGVPVDPTRRYRIRSVVAGGPVLDYSLPEAAGNESTKFGAVRLFIQLPLQPVRGAIEARAAAVCHGSDCPPAEEVFLQMDIDRNRTIGPPCHDANGNGQLDESELLAGRCEQWAMRTREETSVGVRYDGGTLRFPAGKVTPFSYRLRVKSRPDLDTPPGEQTYQLMRNNRIVLPRFTSQLMRANHPAWVAMLTKRLDACLAEGYRGMTLDFAFTGLTTGWIASGVPFVRDGPGLVRWTDDANREAVAELLKALRQRAPKAMLTINGLFVDQDPRAGGYFSYLKHIDGGLVEYFAYGTSSDSLGRIKEAFAGVLRSKREHKVALLMTNGDVGDHERRLDALALYLLLADQRVFFYYATEDTYQSVNYLPEWNVPLGQALQQLDTVDALELERSSGLLTRRFTNGLVLFNPWKRPQEYKLNEPHHWLRVSGGRIAELGGDGELSYQRVSGEITVPPLRGRILVRAR